MGADEEGTLRTLKDYRGAMQRLIERHHGRVFSIAGDSLLAEFSSVVEAVTAAAETQSELATRNHDLSADRQMEFRIGINLGDVIVDGDDLYGEGVNVAARLEGLSEPGGISIPGAVYEQIKNKLSMRFDFMGDQKVKNIEEQVPVYSIHFEGQAVHERSESVEAPSSDGIFSSLTGKQRKRAQYLAFMALFFSSSMFLPAWTHYGFSGRCWQLPSFSGSVGFAKMTASPLAVDESAN